MLNKLSELSKDVKNIEHKSINGQEAEIIKYNNRKTEIIFKDGSKIVTVKNGTKIVSTSYDKDENKKEEKVEDGDNIDTTIYKDGKKTRLINTNINDNTRVTIYYDENEKPSKKELEKDNVHGFYENV